MHLSVKALTIASALIWGGCILFVGVINLADPSYGDIFLQSMSGVYPGFHNAHTVGDVLIGTAYGLVDGAIVGALFAWLYNVFAGSPRALDQ